MGRAPRSQPQPVPDKPVRIAIVGGGCAAMAAAWQLSQRPNYEIHVYERSWRLGGKGASVRDADGRILDHGLHVWLGFYENSFRMMRECYREVGHRKWGPAGGAGDRLAHGRIEEAFFPEPHIGVAPLPPQGDWVAWSGYFPPTKGLPGTPIDEESNPFTLPSYLLRCFQLLKTLIQSVIGQPDDGAPGKPRPEQRSGHDEMMNLDFSVDATRSLQVLIERMSRLLRGGALAGAAALLQSVTIMERWLQQLDDVSPQDAASILKLMEALAAQTRKFLFDFTKADPHFRMKTEIIDIVLTILVGLFRERVLFDPRGLDAVNGYDYRAWLRQHGATFTSLKSPFLTGIYDLVFAYRDGDTRRPSLAAGVAIRGALRMLFTYRGAMFWRMRSGMGDAIFAPLYKVLLLKTRTGQDDKEAPASPVTFHFLHELEEVQFDAPAKGSRYVSSLKFRTAGDPGKLDKCSVAALDDFGCWPARKEDRFGEALESKPETRELRIGTDFDAVIFATGLDDFREIVGRAQYANKDAQLPSHWAKMFKEVKTVGTKSAQVWLNKNLHGLGWYRGSGIFTAIGRSFDTWADMTHTLAAEKAWRRNKSMAPNAYDDSRSVAYFCGTVPESLIAPARGLLDDFRKKTGSADRLEAVEEVAGKLDIDWASLRDSVQQSLAQAAGSGTSVSDLVEQIVAILMNAKVNKDLDRMLSCDLAPLWPAAFKGKPTAKNLQVGRYVQANVTGSERYTLSLPDSVDSRISPLDRSVENMTIAGDWTACGLDTGCVEAAVISGMLAAHAICGEPELESIIGYDHP